jgi:molecular chaperone DnaK (HSP70)
MLSLLLALRSCAETVAIDIGSEYIKLAVSTADGPPSVVIRPNAVSIKVPASQTAPLTASDFASLDVQVGKPAVSLLNRNASIGSAYLGRAIGRSSGSEFRSSPLIDEQQLLLFSRTQFTTSAPAVLTVPFFYTPGQAASLRAACETVGIPISRVVTDREAIFALYASQKAEDFASGRRHIMFVDVGSTAAKVYCAKFFREGDVIKVNQTALGWTEKVGGYHFAKSVGAALGISPKKARKRILSEKFDKRKVHLSALRDLVKKVRWAALEFGDVDEVQLVGGSRAYPFVSSAIYDSTKQPVLEDLNDTAPAAIGALLLGPHIEIAPVSSARLEVVCGDKKVSCCAKAQRCAAEVKIEGSSGCEQFTIVGDPATLPEGADRQIAAYAIAEKVEGEGMTAVVKMAGQGIAGVEWCTGDVCTYYEAKEVPVEFPWIREANEKLLAWRVATAAKETL